MLAPLFKFSFTSEMSVNIMKGFDMVLNYIIQGHNDITNYRTGREGVSGV